jgi:hypothetical protein
MVTEPCRQFSPLFARVAAHLVETGLLDVCVLRTRVDGQVAQLRFWPRALIDGLSVAHHLVVEPSPSEAGRSGAHDLVDLLAGSGLVLRDWGLDTLWTLLGTVSVSSQSSLPCIHDSILLALLDQFHVLRGVSDRARNTEAKRLSVLAVRRLLPLVSNARGLAEVATASVFSLLHQRGSALKSSLDSDLVDEVLRVARDPSCELPPAWCLDPADCPHPLPVPTFEIATHRVGPSESYQVRTSEGPIAQFTRYADAHLFLALLAFVHPSAPGVFGSI